MTEIKIEQFNCPHCGGIVELRAPESSEVVVCSSCKSVLDVSNENVRILQEYKGAITKKPLLPLGSKGKIFEDEFEVIGFLVRKIGVGYETYRWSEYLLFNPAKGFRWLTEYDGHWTKVETIPTPPLKGQWGTLRRDLPFEGATYQHFQRSEPEVEMVLGEFYWKIKVGDKATVNDFVAPPKMISVETTSHEISWSVGTYVEPKEIWQAFQLPGSPPLRRGVFANQPNAYKASARGVGTIAFLLVGFAVVLYLGLNGMAKKETALNQQFTLNATDAEASRVSDPFELKGHTANVRVKTSANVSNSWVFLNMTLINEATDKAIDFGREISYYSGRDSEGPWSEGSPSDTLYLPEVPPGRYYLRIEPERDPRGTLPTEGLRYSVELVRDVPRISYLFLVGILLLIPLGLIKYLSFAFERDRWNEGDHPFAPIIETNEEDE